MNAEKADYIFEVIETNKTRNRMSRAKPPSAQRKADAGFKHK